MTEKEAKSTKNEGIPAICTYRGFKPEVFRRAHKKAQELESTGKVLLSEDWKKIVSESWNEVKKEVKELCSCYPSTSEKLEDELTPEEIKENMQNDQNHSDEEQEETSAEEKQDEQNA